MKDRSGIVEDAEMIWKVSDAVEPANNDTSMAMPDFRILVRGIVVQLEQKQMWHVNIDVHMDT